MYACDRVCRDEPFYGNVFRKIYYDDYYCTAYYGHARTPYRDLFISCYYAFSAARNMHNNNNTYTYL